MLADKTNTPEEIRTKECWQPYCTVRDLKRFITENKLPDDAKVFIQRIEDVYFKKHHWGTIKKEGYLYNSEKELIQKVKDGGFDDKEKYPDFNDESKMSILEGENIIDELKEEYVPVWCPVKYKNDDNLYLDAHY